MSVRPTWTIRWDILPHELFPCSCPHLPWKKRPCVTKLHDKLFHVLTKNKMSASGHLVYLMLFLFAFFLHILKVLLLLLIMNNIFINVLTWIWSRKEHQLYVHVLQIIVTTKVERNDISAMLYIYWHLIYLFIYLFINVNYWLSG